MGIPIPTEPEVSTLLHVGLMRVDLSPRLGGHTVANQPPPPNYCPHLIHLGTV